ncbi:hypothetical protein [Dactylosporangium darangshiense]|uniref:hypothetical protein n=1 Tax=Dactylosporangium darangshiense TaxID=579108 RepID=UPI0031EE7206
MAGRPPLIARPPTPRPAGTTRDLAPLPVGVCQAARPPTLRAAGSTRDLAPLPAGAWQAAHR